MDDPVQGDQLKSIVQRIERLEEEKTALAADIREIYSEAKGDGFDTKVLRQVIRRRRQDKAEVQEQDALLRLARTTKMGFDMKPLQPGIGLLYLSVGIVLRRSGDCLALLRALDAGPREQSRPRPR